jgi:hypothetical protein
MRNYHEIKDKHQKAIDEIITKNQVFFAFSKSQLEDGKTNINITDNRALISIGTGGFCPRINADQFFNEIDKADKDYKKELKDAKQAQEEAILYELNNHESFYRGNMDDVFDMFDGVYTRDEIKAVYKKHNNDIKQDYSND